MVGIDDVLRMDRHGQLGAHRAGGHGIDPDAKFTKLCCLLLGQMDHRSFGGTIGYAKGRGPQA